MVGQDRMVEKWVGWLCTSSEWFKHIEPLWCAISFKNIYRSIDSKIDRSMISINQSIPKSIDQ